VIVGIGTDVLEVARMEAELRAGGAAFREAVFAPAEIAYCEGMRYPARHYAARFAAKEAVFKALGAVPDPGARWLDVEVVREASGRPRVVLHGRAAARAAELGVDAIFATLAHIATLATATVVLESRATPEGGVPPR
jgi:holo-[acyl-carrier protein] synthase